MGSIFPSPLLYVMDSHSPKRNLFPEKVPMGSPSRDRDVAVYASDINQPSLPTPFYSILVSDSILMVLLAVFHSINSPSNSPLSDSVLPVLLLIYWSF